MDRAKSLFFPYGHNNKKKSLDYYAYYLADFAMNELTDRLDDGSNVPLTVQSYITNYSLKIVKKFLMTKEMSSNQQALKLAIKDPSENNFEHELKEFPSAIVNPTNKYHKQFFVTVELYIPRSGRSQFFITVSICRSSLEIKRT